MIFTVVYMIWRYEPQHDKTNKMSVHPAKTQISLGIRPVWSESSLSAWRKLGSLVTHWVHSEDSDQTGRMPKLIWVFAGGTLILLVLSCHGSYEYCSSHGVWVLDLTTRLDTRVEVDGSTKFEPPHVKTNKRTVHPAKTQISLGIRPVWSESLLCAQWVAKDPSFLHADSEDSDQPGRMPRLIWVFAGCTCHFAGFCH